MSPLYMDAIYCCMYYILLYIKLVIITSNLLCKNHLKAVKSLVLSNILSHTSTAYILDVCMLVYYNTINNSSVQIDCVLLFSLLFVVTVIIYLLPNLIVDTVSKLNLHKSSYILFY